MMAFIVGGRNCWLSRRGLRLCFRIATLVDEIPEVFGISERFVFGGELGAEEEVRESALVENAVDNDLIVADLEVEAPVVGAKAIESLSLALHFPKVFAFAFLDFS